MEDKQFRLLTVIVEQCCPVTKEGLTKALFPQGLVFGIRALVCYSVPSPAASPTALPPYVPLPSSSFSHVTPPWVFKNVPFNCSSWQDFWEVFLEQSLKTWAAEQETAEQTPFFTASYHTSPKCFTMSRENTSGCNPNLTYWRWGWNSSPLPYSLPSLSCRFTDGPWGQASLRNFWDLEVTSLASLSAMRLTSALSPDWEGKWETKKAINLSRK